MTRLKIIVYFAAIIASTVRYEYFADTRSWTSARADCVAKGGDLASIADAAENDLVRSVAATASWIGGNDRDNEVRWHHTVADVCAE